jgi:hypothetical protein
MRITRLAAALTSAGAIVLAGVAPASAADPVAGVTPTTIELGGGFTATITGCDQDTAFITTGLLPEDEFNPMQKGGEPGTFGLTIGGTDDALQPGPYKVVFTCGEEGTPPVAAIDVTLAAKPTPTPTPTPEFDADLTPHVFAPGDRLTLTTTGCPTLPTVEDVDGLFTGPLALKETGDQKASGSAVTKTDLSPTKTYHLVVTCTDVGTVTFSAEPGKKTTKHHGGQTGVVPVGGVQTGDGSSLNAGEGATLPMTAGAMVVVAGGLAALAYRRRKARGRARR